MPTGSEPSVTPPLLACTTAEAQRLHLVHRTTYERSCAELTKEFFLDYADWKLVQVKAARRQKGRSTSLDVTSAASRRNAVPLPATAVVPQTPQLYDIPGLSRKWVGHDRFTTPQNRYSLPRGAPGEPGELYKNERLVQYSVGTALLYRHDTWHRGTTTAEGACRLTHSFVWRRADALWVQYGGPWYGCSHNFLAEITPAQRCALGWPAAGHVYWDDPATVEAVGQRYTGVDMTPYHEAAAGRKTRGGDGGASETPRHKL